MRTTQHRSKTLALAAVLIGFATAASADPIVSLESEYRCKKDFDSAERFLECVLNSVRAENQSSESLEMRYDLALVQDGGLIARAESRSWGIGAGLSLVLGSVSRVPGGDTFVPGGDTFIPGGDMFIDDELPEGDSIEDESSYQEYLQFLAEWASESSLSQALLIVVRPLSDELLPLVDTQAVRLMRYPPPQ